MSKTIKKFESRNYVARDMIAEGTGKKQVFKDRRDKRNKDARRKKEWLNYE